MQVHETQPKNLVTDQPTDISFDVSFGTYGRIGLGVFKRTYLYKYISLFLLVTKYIITIKKEL